MTTRISILELVGLVVTYFALGILAGWEIWG